MDAAFAALVLGFPSGRLGGRLDRSIVAGFVFTSVVMQLVWLMFFPFPGGQENAFLISADPSTAHTLDRVESFCSGTLGLILAIVGISRWLRAAPPLRRLLLPTLAGSVTALVLIIQVYYALITGEFIRSSQEITSVLLVSVPLAFLFGLLSQQLARAGMGDLVVALQRAPDSQRLGELLATALGDPSLVLAYWLPRFDAYVDAGGTPVALPAAGSGRAVTLVDNDGAAHRRADPRRGAVDQPELLEVVCAAADVAIERERLQAELRARVVELQASRERIVSAGDAERRRLERNLHDGAQQRLVGDRAPAAPARGPHPRRPVGGGARDDGERGARALARGAARARARAAPGGARARPRRRRWRRSRRARPSPPRCPTRRPAGCPSRSSWPPTSSPPRRWPTSRKYAQATRVTMRVWQAGPVASIEVADDGVGGADDARGSGLRGLADRVEALQGSLRVVSPPGAGTTVTAELPCES